MRLSFATAALLLVPAAASAQTMPLHSFVERGTKLEKKGAMALFSRGEIRALQTEMKGAAAAVRAERLAAEKAGRKPAYCPPKEAQPMGARTFLAELRKVSATQARSATVTDGLRAMLVKRYPCPA